MTYDSYDRALRRAEVLKDGGIWPGIRCHADGTYSLTYDPEAIR